MTNDDLEQFFYHYNGRPIEGFIGNPNECKILFILKEPDTGSAEEFWFKKGVDQCGKGAKRYFHILGKIAAKILDRSGDLDNDDFLQSVLKECAYINLYPIKGETSASDDYKIVLELLENTESDPIEINKKCNHNEIASNRKYLIENINCDYIVTVWDIFDKIIKEESRSNGIKYDGKWFKKGEFSGKPVYYFYHPSYPPISYKKLEEIKINKQS